MSFIKEETEAAACRPSPCVPAAFVSITVTHPVSEPLFEALCISGPSHPFPMVLWPWMVGAVLESVPIAPQGWELPEARKLV